MFILLMGFQKYFEIFVCSSSPFLKDVIKKKKRFSFIFYSVHIHILAFLAMLGADQELSVQKQLSEV